MNFFFRQSLAWMIALLTCAASQAQTWPAKPVRIVTAFGAGSASDIVSRMLATELQEAWRVVLTHLAPGNDAERDTSGYTAGISPLYRGPVTVANDLESF